MSLHPSVSARLDQVHAHTATTLDELVATTREMSADGVDPAEQVALVQLALWGALATRPGDLAGLAATAILRLADQPDRGTR